MIFGVDLSRYQPVEAVDGWSFCLLNVEDGGYRDKIRRCVDLGIIWQPYKWIYPGAPGWTMLDRAKQITEYAGYPFTFCWADYEEAGVTPDQLAGFFERADEYGIGAGYYANAHAVDHQLFLARPFWLAQYPGNNDGSFPGLDQMTSPDVVGRPVEIWQYTSGANDPSGVGLDRNVIIDEAWWARLTGQSGGTAMPDVWKLTSAGPTVPGLDESSEWVDTAGRFLRAADVQIPAGTPRWGISGTDFETLRADKQKILAGTGEVVVVPGPAADATTLTDEVLAAEVTRRLTA